MRESLVPGPPRSVSATCQRGSAVISGRSQGFVRCHGESLDDQPPDQGGPTMNHAVLAEGLAKRFGETTALDGVDLAVRTGTVLGLLGPNGAGKTTAVRILATLLEPDAGRATVGGYDVVSQAHQVRQLLGLTGQFASIDETLTGMENLVLIGRLLGMPRARARDRA